jgi:hypothetical protein
MTRTEQARKAIEGATRDLPANTPLEDRVAIVDAAYPFGLRDHHPYECWLKERSKYLKRFGWQPAKGRPRKAHETALSRAKRLTMEAGR